MGGGERFVDSRKGDVMVRVQDATPRQLMAGALRATERPDRFGTTAGDAEFTEMVREVDRECLHRFGVRYHAVVEAIERDVFGWNVLSRAEKEALLADLSREREERL